MHEGDLPLDRPRTTAVHADRPLTSEEAWCSSRQLKLTDGAHDVRLLGRSLGLAY